MATLKDLATLLKTKINKKVDGGGNPSFSGLTVNGSATITGDATVKGGTNLQRTQVGYLTVMQENDEKGEGGQIQLKGASGNPDVNLDVYKNQVRFHSSGQTIAYWEAK